MYIMTRQDLKEKLSHWYNGHRWSPTNAAEVFNPFSIHSFMHTGLFEPYWANSGTSSLLLKSGLLIASVVRAAMGQPTSLPVNDLKCPIIGQTAVVGGPPVITEHSQLSLLTVAGVLAIDRVEGDRTVWLKVPNEDAMHMASMVVASAVPLSSTVDCVIIANFCVTGNFTRVLQDPVMIKAMKQCLGMLGSIQESETWSGRVGEFHLSLSLSVVILAILPKLHGILYRTEVNSPKVDLTITGLLGQADDVKDNISPRLLVARPPEAGRLWAVDHIFNIIPKRESHLLEFKVEDRELEKSALLKLLGEALYQCLKYQLVIVDDGFVKHYSAYVFNRDGILRASTPSLPLDDAHRLASLLIGGEAVPAAVGVFIQ